MEGRIVNVWKLLALDNSLLGPPFITIGFGIGTPAVIVLGLYVICPGQPALRACIELPGSTTPRS
jgi:hypothetical protein